MIEQTRIDPDSVQVLRTQLTWYADSITEAQVSVFDAANFGSGPRGQELGALVHWVSLRARDNSIALSGALSKVSDALGDTVNDTLETDQTIADIIRTQINNVAPAG